jgi:two-component system, OmpR family, response regulator
LRLLLVEDDAALANTLAEQLRAAAYAVDTVHDGAEAEFMGASEPYDVVVLDLGLPGKPGLEVLKAWRAAGVTTPVLILTARGAWHEKVEGFRSGADDYLAKPFHVEELQARLQALIRRAHGAPAGQMLEAGQLVLDEARQSARMGDREWMLTGTEYRLLRYFMLHPGRVLSTSHLLEHVYDYDSEKESNVIEVYIARLRRKFGKGCIQTRRGQGYVFDPEGLCTP